MEWLSDVWYWLDEIGRYFAFVFFFGYVTYRTVKAETHEERIEVLLTAIMVCAVFSTFILASVFRESF